MRITINNICLLIITTSIVSCLKNGNNDIDLSTAGASVYLPLAASNSNRIVSFSFTGVPSATIPFYINLASPNTLTNNVTATLAIDSGYLNSYNTINSTSYQVMPDSDYTVLNGWDRTIPAGQRLDSMYVKFDFTKMNPTKSYIFPVTIKNASVSIEQWNHLMINFPVSYTVTGWFFHPSAGRVINITKNLSTINDIRVEGQIGDLGAVYPFQFDIINNILTNWSSNAPLNSSGFMTEDNPGSVDYSDPSNGGHLPGDALFNKTIYNNTYDPATKTFYMHYGYQNGASVDQNGYSRQIYEKWVRQ
jgi:Domain of unknown function (DUF1735).